MRVRFYKSRNGWRWTIYSGNGKKLANCGQGYSRQIDAIRGFTAVVGEDPAFTGWTVEGL